MKLLLDENLSPKLLQSLEHEFPESKHIENVKLRGSSDEEIWDYARLNGLRSSQRTPTSENEALLRVFRRK